MKLVDHPRVYSMRSDHPDSAVYVGRPSIWGNPFQVRDFGREDSIKMYRLWLMSPDQSELREQMRVVLKGRDLLCWCSPEPCHADVIIEVANENSPPPN